MENAGEKAKTPALAVGDGFLRPEAESLDSAENRGHGLPGDATVGTYRAPLGPNPKQLDGGPGAAPRRPAGHALTATDSPDCRVCALIRLRASITYSTTIDALSVLP